MLSAVMAAIIYNRLNGFYAGKTQNNKSLEKLRDDFVGLANRLAENAYKLDSKSTFSLLEARIARIGGINIMQLAYRGKLQLFIASN